MGKAIVIVSGKGGTGKTMLTANLGATLALQGHKVVVIDLDTGLRNLDLYLGMENNIVYDINDVLTGVCRIRQALVKVKAFPGLLFMAASPQKPTGEITPLHIKVLCNKLKQKYDYVLIDAPAGIDDGMRVATGGADMGIIVVTPEYSSLRNAENVKETLEEQGIEKISYVVNKIDLKLIEQGKAPSFEEVTKNIRDKIVGIIQKDDNIHVSTNLGIPIVSILETQVSKSFMAMGMRIKKLLA
ncbi:MAG: septum site-determining protein MinD, partial [Firmicutes bacterium]|nr:septum site-determining protein MinD [Bacillota bacterium]